MAAGIEARFRIIANSAEAPAAANRSASGAAVTTCLVTQTLMNTWQTKLLAMSETAAIQKPGRASANILLPRDKTPIAAKRAGPTPRTRAHERTDGQCRTVIPPYFATASCCAPGATKYQGAANASAT